MTGLTQSGAMFAARWAERKYWSGVPALLAIRSIRKMMEGDQIGDKLESEMKEAEEGVRIALHHYRYHAEQVEPASMALMTADIERRPTCKLFDTVLRRKAAAGHAREEYNRMKWAAFEATKRYSNWCQGMI